MLSIPINLLCHELFTEDLSVRLLAGYRELDTVESCGVTEADARVGIFEILVSSVGEANGSTRYNCVIDESMITSSTAGGFGVAGVAIEPFKETLECDYLPAGANGQGMPGGTLCFPVGLSKRCSL